MKKIINGKLYNTETAKKLGDWESDQDYRGLYHEEESLYRTKSGNYFLWCYGGAASRYNQQIGQNEWSSGELIQPISEDRAKKWAEDRLDGDSYERIFGEISEGESETVSVILPPDVVAKLKEEMERSSKKRTDVIVEALRQDLK